jgi:hypothetical protein
MELQEKGGSKKSKGNFISMPQSFARGGDKRKVVNRQLYLSKIRRQTVRWSKRKGSNKSRIVATAYMANKLNKFLSYKNNVYKINSFSKSNNKITFKKSHIYNFQKSAKVKSAAWLEPATRKPIADSQNIYNSQVKKLLTKDII